ncbi:MAG: hypothetical protein KC561_21045, partial [Myxococcales bacterium]|nr:hypothetical protein [Myxococcales bacterium]
MGTEPFHLQLRRTLERAAREHPESAVMWPGLSVPRRIEHSLALHCDRFPADAEMLIERHGYELPKALLAQFCPSVDGLGELLWKRGPRTALPRLASLLDGLQSELVRLGFNDSLALPSEFSIASLFRLSLFGSGAPMLGLLPAQRATLAAALGDYSEPAEALDRHLADALLHELCHGPDVEVAGEDFL